ncbi:AraC family transcriptional regulator [Paenibacillus paridis]|uniref:AraC family transcriptional regulator n=1 Tax=Paenibacillus paridis TaxID=2583376 RepID=UPI00111CC804|nr:AraC family transcriptional regulator [Paenibacillus paridis]
MKPSAQLFKAEFFFDHTIHLLVNRYTEDFTVPFHAHDFIEYCYVAEGKGFHHIEQETIPVSKGMLFAIPVGVSHVFRPTTPDAKGNPLIVYNCLFDSHMVDQLTVMLMEQPIQEHLTDLRNRRIPYFSVSDHDGSIESLVQMLYREMSVQGIGSATMLHTLLSQLVVTAYRKNLSNSDKPRSEVANFDQILQFLKQNMHEAVTLSELARVSKWSDRHLQRLFQRQTGQSFGSYLQNLRVQKSCELLRSSEHKISSIAERVGYRDMDSFNAVFKKIVGQPPRQYRKLYRPNGSP